MPQSIGPLIRQLRREQNKTQTELGGTAFSKSYVSAVESEKLAPSNEALKHFALSLGRSEEYFLTITNPAGVKALLSVPDSTIILGPDVVAQEKATLLNALLNQPDYTEIQTPEAFFSLEAGIFDLLASPDQAHYYFFQGMMSRKRQEYSSAIEYLERALARETHPEHSAIMLHEISKCYFQMHLPQMALHYALRAHQAVENSPAIPGQSSLPFQIELHGGSVFLTLGLYQHALEHFEKARAHLTSRTPMQQAGQLYQGLGYCAYALAYQQASTPGTSDQHVDLLYQQALTYLLQGLTLVQMVEDAAQTNSQRLLLATLKLDWSIWHAHRQRQQKRTSQPATGAGLASLSALLDEASEQCQQVLASFNEIEGSEEAFQAEAKTIYIALTLLIRVSVQHALLAYEQGYESTFQREQALASSLCQQTLDSCQAKEALTSLIFNMQNLAEQTIPSTFAALPRLPKLFTQADEVPLWPGQANLAEVCFAAGEVAELLGKTATSDDFTRDCQSSADRSFLHALALLKNCQNSYPDASGYLTRAYQRYIALLEARLLEAKEWEHKSSQLIESLLMLCKQQIQPSRSSLPSGI